MSFLYYIGGPADLTKKVISKKPDVIHYVVETQPTSRWTEDFKSDQLIAGMDIRQHEYRIFNLEPELFVAIYQGARA